MARAETEAERLRRCRTLFEAAQVAGTTPAELTQRQAMARWSAIDGRLAAKRARVADEGQPLAWWQQ